jgi:hypothetical protein
MASISDRLRETVLNVLDGSLTTQELCVRYETEYNTPDQVEWASIDEGLIFQELFDAVVWYSPYPEDRARYKGYVDDVQIKKAAQQVAARLGLRTGDDHSR